MSVPLMKYWSISSEILTNEAKKLGLQVKILDKENNFFIISSDTKEIFFKSTDFGGNSSLGLKIANNKALSYKLFEHYNLPIPKTWYIEKNNINIIDKIGDEYPLIIKPLNEGHGNGVMMNIRNKDELNIKLKQSFEVYDTMIIQKQVQGDEYRFLVMNGEVILVRKREPAHIFGDGKNSIQYLIDKENTENPLRGEGYNAPLAYIKIDQELEDFISKQNLQLSVIPGKGEKIYLRGNSNIGTGGISINTTDVTHESIKTIACKAAEKTGLMIAGVDIMTTDITQPLEKTGGIILEINATPGIGGDIELTGVNTGKIILEKLFFT